MHTLPSIRFAKLALVLAVVHSPANSVLAQAKKTTAGSKAPAKSSPVKSPAPSVPTAGTLFEVRVANGQCASVTAGSLAGEPLHFRLVNDTAVAIGAIPIDSTNGIALKVRCANGDSSITRINTRAGSYRLEKLSVAPKFSAPPDSALVRRQRQEAERAAAVSREAHDTPRMWTKPFVVPRTSRITSPFGGGRTFNNEVTSRHMGTDYAGATGAPIRASNRGIVRIVDAFYLGGNVVYIDHGEGLVTAYLHLSKQLVAVGDTVNQGDVIGNVGATGRVTGPHLHFIVRYGQVTVDAASVYRLK